MTKRETLYLIYMQEEKKFLLDQRCGTGEANDLASLISTKRKDRHTAMLLLFRSRSRSFEYTTASLMW
ncbi:unnamed protein product [Euphydryas editha]|uniref:Uncharacterized protein n=1 Tax=Euphydryas editha TaxID=104508 RepID=A0AAU9TK21_EUPED|nr:unnamed protein product [Euphydryas editha]